MTLSELTTQFTGLMNRRDLSANSALVTNFISQSVMRIQRELRCPAMEKTVDVTIASGYTGLTIPSDFLELISLTPQSPATKRELTRARPDVVSNLAANVGAPMVYSRQGGQWILGPAPAEGDVVRVYYYAELTPLLNPTDTNVVSEVAWDLIVYGALAFACEYYNDKRGTNFEARYQQILADLNGMATDDELEGLTAVQPMWEWPEDDTDNYEIWVV